VAAVTRAVRSLRKTPGFSAAVVLTLTLGLAANAAFFAVVDALLLRPLPYADPDRLAVLFEVQPGSRARALVSPPNFLSWKRASRTFADMAAFRSWGFVLSGPDGADRIVGARVSANLLDVLGVRPIAGRGFLPQEDVYGAPHVAIVSYGMWRQRLGAPASLDGRAIVLSGVAHTIVGVLPPDFRMPGADVLVPLALEPFALTQRGNRAMTVVGRLAGGTSLASARAELDRMSRELAVSAPEADAGWGSSAVLLADDVTGRFRSTLLILWAAVALVLIIACANTAGLTLARAASRRQQIAVFRALGAGRGVIVRGLIAETALLAIVSGLLALPLARAMLAALVAIAPPGLARFSDASIDLRVMAFSMGVALLVGVLFGLPAALRGSRDDLSPLLRSGRWAADGHGGLRRAALAGQLALAILVLVGSGLLLRSLERVLAVDPGFDPSHVLTIAIAPDARYGDAARRAGFFAELIDRIAAIPGVRAVGTTSHPPLGSGPLTVDVTIEGSIGSQPAVIANYSAVGGNWFGAMSIPLRSGRAFSARDVMGGPPVVILSEHLARALWPQGNSVGRRLIVGGSVGADRTPREVVGVAGDVHMALEAEAPFQIYIPYSQNPWPTMTLAVRTDGDPGNWSESVRDAVRAVDRDQAGYNLMPLDQLVGRAVAPRRFQVSLILLFALFAGVLSAMGVHAVITYAVRQRTPEIGVRLALGASRRSVAVLALREVLQPAAAGIAIGLCFAPAAGHLMSGLLFGVRPTDALTIAGSVLGMIVLVLAASLVAARRASSIDPLAGLRHQ
jgi:putative ABC transport system permease protein